MTVIIDSVECPNASKRARRVPSDWSVASPLCVHLCRRLCPVDVEKETARQPYEGVRVRRPLPLKRTHGPAGQPVDVPREDVAVTLGEHRIIFVRDGSHGITNAARESSRVDYLEAHAPPRRTGRLPASHSARRPQYD